MCASVFAAVRRKMCGGCRRWIDLSRHNPPAKFIWLKDMARSTTFNIPIRPCLTCTHYSLPHMNIDMSLSHPCIAIGHPPVANQESY
jgi:hypothetical protein